jgi:hypothetical protein
MSDTRDFKPQIRDKESSAYLGFVAAWLAFVASVASVAFAASEPSFEGS